MIGHGHLRLVTIAILLTMAARQTAGQNYTLLQTPPGNQLDVNNGSTSKFVLRVVTQEEGLMFNLAINKNKLINPKGFKNDFIAVIYNTCTDSDHPDLICLEIQATIVGKPKISGLPLTAYLWRWNDNRMQEKNISEFNINVLAEVDGSSTSVPETEMTEMTESPGTTDSYGNHVNAGAMSSSHSLTVACGYALAGVSLLVNVALGLVVFLVCKCRRDKRKSIELEK